MPPVETRATYHHGALRKELITATVALIESEGIGAVSLRRVAREAGVSAGAPYHHFPDRAALLNAVTAQGYALLLDELRAATDAVGPPAAKLGALIGTYVRFARANTAYARLMYRPELSETGKDPATSALADEALQLLTGIVTACQQTGDAPAGNPAPLVTMAWSIAAGVAMLSVDGPLDHMATDWGSSVSDLTAQVTELLGTMLTRTRWTAGEERP